MRLISKAAAVIFSAVMLASCGGDASSAVLTASSVTSAPEAVVTDEDVYRLFSQSVMIGTSIGRDRAAYYDSMGEGYLGSPVMLVKGSYSFISDEGRKGEDLMVSYNGKAAPARECVKACGAKYVFVNVGANDIYHSIDPLNTDKDYKKYIEGILELSPDAVIFIESLTPITEDGQIQQFTNETLDHYNARMKEYADSHEGIYYIDVSTPMKNDNNALRTELSRDNYIHLTDEAYRIWTETEIEYIREYLRTAGH